MSAGFTKGPWYYGDEDESVVGVHYVDVHAGEYSTKSYRCTASVEGPFIDGEFAPLDDETRANARLIAAAPELYEALDIAEAQMSTARIEINRLRKVAKLPDLEPAALNVAVYKAKTALSKARGEGQ